MCERAKCEKNDITYSASHNQSYFCILSTLMVVKKKQTKEPIDKFIFFSHENMMHSSRFLHYLKHKSIMTETVAAASHVSRSLAVRFKILRCGTVVHQITQNLPSPSSSILYIRKNLTQTQGNVMK